MGLVKLLQARCIHNKRAEPGAELIRIEPPNGTDVVIDIAKEVDRLDRGQSFRPIDVPIYTPELYVYISDLYLSSMRLCFDEAEKLQIYGPTEMLRHITGSDSCYHALTGLFYEQTEIANIKPTDGSGFMVNCDERVHDWLEHNIEGISRRVIATSLQVLTYRTGETPPIKTCSKPMSLTGLLSGQIAFKNPNFNLRYWPLEDYEKRKAELGEYVEKDNRLFVPRDRLYKRDDSKSDPSDIRRTRCFRVNIAKQPTVEVAILKDKLYMKNAERLSQATGVKVVIVDVNQQKNFAAAKLEKVIYATEVASS